jgi:hypothetical protein
LVAGIAVVCFTDGNDVGAESGPVRHVEIDRGGSLRGSGVEGSRS